MSRTASDLKTIVKEIADEMAERTDRGEVANYIPELANVHNKRFGLVVIDGAGNVAAAGDSEMPFSIQSISKVFTLTLALGLVGDRLWQRVGREPSGSPFNSIVQLEYERGKPRNPFINAGAIAVTDVILSGHQPREAIGEIRAMGVEVDHRAEVLSQARFPLGAMPRLAGLVEQRNPRRGREPQDLQFRLMARFHRLSHIHYVE